MQAIVEGFILGNASILNNVCLLPLYPGMVAFLLGNSEDERMHRWTAILLGVLVLLGVLSMMLIIGVFFSILSGLYRSVLPIIVVVSYVVVVVFGLMMLAGFNPFARMTTVNVPMLQNPFATAYLYGLLLAPMTLPCTGPVILAALGRGATGGGALFSELTYFIAFGFGFGWPLALLPLIAIGTQRRFISWVTTHHVLISRTAGLLLVVIGIFGLWVEARLLF